MKPFSITIVKYSGILLLWVLILWWGTFFSPLNIPEFIPHTPIKVYGLLFFGFTLTILILAQKEFLTKNTTLNVVNLTLLGAAICFINEVVFQFIISFTETSDKLYYFIRGTVTTTILWTVLSFFTAFQLKTRRTGQLILFILVFIVLFKVLTMAFPAFFKS
jgi:hypothetical protein